MKTVAVFCRRLSWPIARPTPFSSHWQQFPAAGLHLKAAGTPLDKAVLSTGLRASQLEVPLTAVVILRLHRRGPPGQIKVAIDVRNNAVRYDS
jgi:hypothetical protein